MQNGKLFRNYPYLKFEISKVKFIFNGVAKQIAFRIFLSITQKHGMICNFGFLYLNILVIVFYLKNHMLQFTFLIINNNNKVNEIRTVT